MSQKTSSTILFTLRPEEKNALVQLAKENELTLSSYLRFLIKNHLSKSKTEPSEFKLD